jgi:hypothetical protein
MSLTLEQMECRIARLEARLRALVMVGIAGLSLLTLGALAGEDSDGVVRTRALEVVDESGRVRAALRTEKGHPELVLYDASGTPRASLLQDPDQSALFLRDAEGTIRVGAAHFAHGGGGIALHGEESRGAVALYLAEGRGALSFYGPDGTLLHRVPAPTP